MSSKRDLSGNRRDSFRIFQELDPTLESNLEGYGELLAQYSNFNTPSEGEVVRGRVVKITANDVIVDVGYKSEGMIPLQEFRRFDGSISVEAGDEITTRLAVGASATMAHGADVRGAGGSDGGGGGMVDGASSVHGLRTVASRLSRTAAGLSNGGDEL